MKTEQDIKQKKAIDAEVAAVDAITVLVLGAAAVVGLLVAGLSALLAGF